ncbi:S8 family serine peptidase [Natronospira sp. AB-CW4]|uniref:S8 family serine peptidase n=1 Tax=Natronospira bacteriovora TaxID=3069753 RepID=A0ABU0W7L4_9GAMM|nr:S8 family serine peptidase [Natronospira sp. AB-CW4]MDQ2070023.1 S8 family serine peptidase [Natronospira sp. AB-CW4]
MDTGVRAEHDQFFSGQVERIHDRFDSEGDFNDTCDSGYDPCPGFCPIQAAGVHGTLSGHGTAVAGMVGALDVGAAKGALIKDLRVFDCKGYSQASLVIDAINDVADHASAHGSTAVLNMSFGYHESVDQVGSMESAIRDLPSRVLPIASAGNDNADASTQVPARMSEVLTVGSSTIDDSRAGHSNWGAAIDLFAPGEDVEVLWDSSDSATIRSSGTSFAAPLVAGVAAIHIDAVGVDVFANDVRTAIMGNVTESVLSNLSGSPNKLLYQWHRPDDDGGGDDGSDPPSCPYQDEDGQWVMCP